MTEPVVTDETIPLDPLLEDLASFLARIRSSTSRQTVTQIDANGFSTGAMATLEKLEEIYSVQPV